VRAHVVDFKTGAVPDGVERAASEFRLQMQIYAHAVRRLVPGVSVVEATLHFLRPGPDVEYDMPAELIGETRAQNDLARVLTEIERGGLDPVMFEARPARRCRSCAFAEICPEGSAHLAAAAETALA
jgi:CRISPR/Cas system-associated exonuclease Cas4 (RecB family)